MRNPKRQQQLEAEAPLLASGKQELGQRGSLTSSQLCVPRNICNCSPGPFPQLPRTIPSAPQDHALSPVKNKIFAGNSGISVSFPTFVLWAESREGLTQKDMEVGQEEIAGSLEPAWAMLWFLVSSVLPKLFCLFKLKKKITNQYFWCSEQCWKSSGFLNSFSPGDFPRIQSDLFHLGLEEVAGF